MSYHLLSTQVSQTKKGSPTLAVSEHNYLKPVLNAVPRGTVALRVQKLQGTQKFSNPGVPTGTRGQQHQTSFLGFSHQSTNKLTESLPTNAGFDEEFQTKNSNLDDSMIIKHEGRITTSSSMISKQISPDINETKRPLSRYEIVPPGKYLRKTTSEISTEICSDITPLEVNYHGNKNLAQTHRSNITYVAKDTTTSYKSDRNINSGILELVPKISTSRQGFRDNLNDGRIQIPYDQDSETKYEKENSTTQDPPASLNMHSPMHHGFPINRSKSSSRLSSSTEVYETEESRSHFKVFKPIEQERDRKPSLQIENGAFRKTLGRPKPSPIQFDQLRNDNRGTVSVDSSHSLVIYSPKKLTSQKTPKASSQNISLPLPVGSPHYPTRAATRVKNSPFFIQDAASSKMSPNNIDDLAPRVKPLFPENSPVPSFNPSASDLEHTKLKNPFYQSSYKLKQAINQVQDNNSSVTRNNTVGTVKPKMTRQSTLSSLQSPESHRESTTSLAKKINLSERTSEARSTQDKCTQKFESGEYQGIIISGSNSENNRLRILHCPRYLSYGDKLKSSVHNQNPPLLRAPQNFTRMNVRSKSTDGRQQKESNFDNLNHVRSSSDFLNSKEIRPMSYEKKTAIATPSKKMKGRNLSTDKFPNIGHSRLARRQSTVSMFELSEKNSINYDLCTEVFGRDSWEDQKWRERKQKLINPSQMKKTVSCNFNSTRNSKGQETKTYDNPTTENLTETVSQLTKGRWLDLPHVNLAYHDSLWRRDPTDRSNEFQNSHEIPLSFSSIKGITLTFHLEGNEEIVFDTVPRINP